jgi:hypothetical protein
MKFLAYRLREDAEGKNDDCAGVQEEPKSCGQGDPPAVKHLGSRVRHFGHPTALEFPDYASARQ